MMYRRFDIFDLLAIALFLVCLAGLVALQCCGTQG